MKALVYTATMEMEIRDVPAPDAGAGRVVLDVACCGICGSDMHAYHGKDPRRVPPLVLGHEAAGVARSGKFAGRRVVVNPLMTCGKCAVCREGREHLCAERELIGMRLPGAFAEQVAIDERNLLQIPDTLSDTEAALTEPLACAVHAVRLGRERLFTGLPDARITVLGGGAIGLLCALVAREDGATDIAVAETNARRRDTLSAMPGLSAYDPLGQPPPEASSDLVIDAVGSGRTRAAASALAKPGGQIVHIGLQDSEPGLDTRRLTLQEIGFVGTYCYDRRDFSRALELLARGLARDHQWLETRPLDAGARSFADIHDGKAAPKIILQI